jgi:hypothetical protein
MDVGVIPSASVGVGNVAASLTGVIEPFVDHSVDQDPGGW